MEGCSTKPDGEDCSFAVSELELLQTEAFLPPVGQPEIIYSALELLEGYIVWAFGNQNGHSGLPRETVGEGPGAYAGNRSEFEEA